ncbi:MAG: hypothetical protein R2856_18135 [Caldilineaceae bacterium]
MAWAFSLPSRIANGTLYFYISERYAWLTLAAVIGLLLVGISYRGNFGHAHHHHHHEDDDDHAHEDHIRRSITTRSTITTITVTVSPGVGLSSWRCHCVGPAGATTAIGCIGHAKPRDRCGRGRFGDAHHCALDSRQRSAGAQHPRLGDGFPQRGSNLEGFADVEAEVIGFVYRDDDTAADTFWVSRFIVGCCVADAARCLAVQWGQTDTLPEGEWVLRVAAASAKTPPRRPRSWWRHRWRWCRRRINRTCIRSA